MLLCGHLDSRGGGFTFPRLFRNVGCTGMLITLCRIRYDVPQQHAPEMISLRTTMERILHCFEVSCTSVHSPPPRVLQPFSIFQHLVEDLHPLQLPTLHLLQIMLDPGRLELELGSILGAVLARMVGGSMTMKQGTQKLSESEGLQCLLQHLLVLLQGLYLAVEQLVALLVHLPGTSKL